ncbi:hypothetical protein [Marinibacterium profundimaris]|nr:hypothetical protein [Marinibacterium profundimaris]
MAKRIYLHAGAHRTGSSSFQLCLHDNRAVLEAHGYDVAYPGRDGVPGGQLRLRLPAPRHEGARMGRFAGSVRGAVKQFSPDPGRALVISEENVPGRMFHFFQGRFLPASAMRLRCLREGLEDAELHLLYVLRSYDEIFASAWRKRAEDNKVEDFQSLAPRFLDMDRGWPELMAEMREILRPARMVLLPYEARGSSRELLTRLLPDLAGADLNEPEAQLNLSATDAGITALQDRYRAGETLSREQWQEVVRRYAEERDDLGLTRFTEADRAVLRDRYARDLDRIAAMDGVEMA